MCYVLNIYVSIFLNVSFKCSDPCPIHNQVCIFYLNRPRIPLVVLLQRVKSKMSLPVVVYKGSFPTSFDFYSRAFLCFAYIHTHTRTHTLW